MFMGEIQDRDEKIGIKNSEIVDMKRHLDELRKSLKDSETSMSRVSPDTLPYSAGIPNYDLASRLVIDKLENDVSEANSENAILKSWVSQIDKELTYETNMAHSYRGHAGPSQQQSSQSNKRITDLPVKRLTTKSPMELRRTITSLRADGAVRLTLMDLLTLSGPMVQDHLQNLLVCLQFEDHNVIQQMTSPQRHTRQKKYRECQDGRLTKSTLEQRGT